MRKSHFLFIAGFLLALNVLGWQEIFALNEKQYLKVNFLNVGQGDSAFVETPLGQQILIDGGPDSAVLEKLAKIIPFWDKDLDLVILSHPEKDHMQGLLFVLEKYKADYILWNGIKKTSAEYDAWLNVLEKQKKMGAKIIFADVNKEIKAGNVLIDVLAPLESTAGKEIKSSSNDTGVVAKLIYGENSFLFSADIDTAEEKKIVNSGENILSDVLKVAHHGSKYSTSDLFLAGVSPKVAVIEVGKNSYGHPTSEVLNRLENFGIKVLRTDTDGDIKFISDGKNINLINK